MVHKIFADRKIFQGYAINGASTLSLCKWSQAVATQSITLKSKAGESLCAPFTLAHLQQWPIVHCHTLGSDAKARDHSTEKLLLSNYHPLSNYVAKVFFLIFIIYT